MIYTGTFEVLDRGTLKTFTKYDDVPSSFYKLIRCEFDYPPGPHTDEEHEAMELFNDKLQELLTRETEDNK